MTKSLKLIALSSIAVISVGCSNAQDQTRSVKQSATPTVEATAVKQVQKQTHKQTMEHGHKKLSAAIDLTHDFNGRGILGSSQTINFDIVNNYGGGNVVFEVKPSEGVRVFNNTGFSEPTEAQGLQSTSMTFAGEAPQNLSLQMQPLSEGAHKIVVLAKVNLPNGQFMTRSFVIPVYVGEDFQPTKDLTYQNAKKPEPIVSGGLVIMDAEETIED